MKNWKTTASGILAAAGQLLPILGIPAEIGAAVTTLALFLIGLFAKDNNVTGGSVRQ